MEKVFFCKFGAFALLLWALAVSANPLHEAEDAITVPTIQFRSKSGEGEEVCTGYQIRGHLYATLAHCLGTEQSEIHKIRELDFVEQGTQKVQAFALRADSGESAGDIAVVLYNGKEYGLGADHNGIFEKFGLVPKIRVERQDEEAAGASFAEINVRLVAAALALVGSVVLK
ncbi:uncharacterized protein LOC129731932 [Wyeomyia smithii]|uniref:uncharacterized protein LOC129731932 n=1 Tax=Wyeomyia smithii TaxID=174621 RepID=UPI002467DBFF|nr:uncharacterized protein LOC129731932 [Wyeomyia smithii]